MGRGYAWLPGGGGVVDENLGTVVPVVVADAVAVATVAAVATAGGGGGGTN